MARISHDVHPSLTPKVLSKLFTKSIFTISCFVRTNSELLAKITGLHYSQILHIKDRILLKFSSALKTGDKHYKEFLNHCAILPTGIKNFDKLLNGGVVTGNLYELCGFAGCGKTQTCMTVSINLCRFSRHKVLYIDTKNDASGYRFHDMAEHQNISDIGEVLRKIKVFQIKSAYGLLKELSQLDQKLKLAKRSYVGFKLIIIDSLSALFQKFHNHNDSLSLLNSIASLLKYLCVEYHLVILLTNLVTAWTPDAVPHDFEKEHLNVCRQIEHPGLGKFWAHVPNVRISLKKLKGKSECMLIVLKSLNQPVGKSAKIKLGDKGII